jgi:hypothetical protein
MSLKVFSCCTYSTLFQNRTKAEWNALQFVRAIKGRPLRGYARVPLPDGTCAFLDQSNVASAPAWFGQMATARLTWHRIRNVTLIPIPDATCDLTAIAAPKALALSAALALAVSPKTATVTDVLRWDQPMIPAHAGAGTRDPQELYSALRLRCGQLPSGLSEIVLVDDVIATGAHLRAAAAFLRDFGGHVLAAVCAGRADNSGNPVNDPFGTRTEILPDFHADPDWCY